MNPLQLAKLMKRMNLIPVNVKYNIKKEIPRSKELERAYFIRNTTG